MEYKVQLGFESILPDVGKGMLCWRDITIHVVEVFVGGFDVG